MIELTKVAPKVERVFFDSEDFGLVRIYLQYRGNKYRFANERDLKWSEWQDVPTVSEE